MFIIGFLVFKVIKIILIHILIENSYWIFEGIYIAVNTNCIIFDFAYNHKDYSIYKNLFSKKIFSMVIVLVNNNVCVSFI